jgi:hypothetical protein
MPEKPSLSPHPNTVLPVSTGSRAVPHSVDLDGLRDYLHPPGANVLSCSFTPSIEIISIIPFYSIITLVVYCFVHHLAVSFVVIVLLVAYLSYALFIYLMSSTKRVKQHARITISQRARRPHSQRLDTVSENVHDVVSPLLRPLWKPKCHAGRHLRADKDLP